MNKAQLYQTNLCKEIVLSPQQICMLGTDSFDYGVFYAPYVPKMNKPKYQFSRAEWYTTNLDANPLWRLSEEYITIIEWCTEKFGPHPTKPDAWTRWWVGLGVINFRDEQDYILFSLRWGS